MGTIIQLAMEKGGCGLTCETQGLQRFFCIRFDKGTGLGQGLQANEKLNGTMAKWEFRIRGKV